VGYRLDSESGLYQVRRRHYHPTLGRWVQRDPLGYHDGMNSYEYVQSRPVISRDPTGLEFVQLPTEEVEHLSAGSDGRPRYGKTDIDMELTASCKKCLINDCWKIELKKFLITAKITVRTHYYDYWYRWRDIGFETNFPELGEDPFERTRKNINRTIAHEQIHVDVAKAWHDSNEEQIEDDLNSSCKYVDEPTCKAAKDLALSVWKGNFAAADKLNAGHKTPEWDGKPKTAHRERKPKEQK